MKWHVIVTYDASRTFEVEAETEEEAKEKAMDEADIVCLCHYCADQIDIGDAIEAVEAWKD